MKKVKRVVSLLTILAICLGVVGCGKTTTTSTKIDTLSMYLIGDKPADYGEVLDKVNEKLKKDVGAVLEVKFLGWAEWSQKYPLILSSGEPVDMVYIGSFTNYRDYSQKGAFTDITDLMKKYAPEAYEKLDKNILETVKVDGKVYCFPANYKEVNPFGYVVRGDLMKKYGMTEIKSRDDFMDYLRAVKKNENIIPYNAGKTDQGLGVGSNLFSISTGLMCSYADKDYDKLYTYADNKKTDLELYGKIHEGYEEGLWPKDVIMNSLASKDAFVKGTSAATICNLKNFNDVYAKVNASNPEWEPMYFRCGQEFNTPPTFAAGSGIGICRTSKNVEKSLKVINLFNTDKEYNRLTTFGIEGKHYVEKDPGVYSFPDGVDASNTGFLPDQAGNWGWRNEEFFMTSDSSWPKYNETVKECEKIAVWKPYSDFTVDTTPISTELASVSAVGKEYNSILNWGTSNDYKKTYEEKISKLKQAGMDKIIDEEKKQFAEYKKNK